ncbi:AAA-like domain-containing protein [Chloracidobacterium validum]|uniref:AAA-like domain-containing protein n=1 Tax=Chloracidobacterium validum TaxID=2821543 RepID=A0ABX8BCF4_9BACT|nr:AAA-like domain-containing protein [Chloracidobacterium validum]QUW02760.1 AAA-like domain-containing protein [Chloracidobacterium validum]
MTTASLTTAQNEFFVTGGTLREDAVSYVIREADESLYTGLRAGEFCYVLTSRQMGKSSLMLRTASRLKADGVKTVILDLTRLGQNLTAEQWYLNLLTIVGERTGLEDELDDFWFEHKDVGPWLKWATALRTIVLEKIKSPIVVMIDEIDVVRSLPFSTDEFFAGIREFYNRRTQDPELNRLSFALFGVATPSDLIRDTRLTPFNIGKRIELSDFRTEEAKPLAAGLAQGKKGVEVLEKILEWTGGHPYLTQRMCREVLKSSETLTRETVDALCARLFLSPKARTEDDNLLFVRDRLLRTDVDLAGLLELYRQTWEGKRPRDEETNPLVGALKLSGVVQSADGKLRVRNRIYERVFDQDWINTNMPDAEIRRQQAALRKGRLQVAAAAAVVILMLAGLSGIALLQRNRALEAQSNLLFERGLTEMASDNPIKAVISLNEAYRLRKEANLGDDPNLRFALKQAMKPIDSCLMAAKIKISPQPKVSPNGQRLIAVTKDNIVRIWDTQSGKELRKIEINSLVNWADISSDKTKIAIASDNKLVEIWDIDSEKELKQFSEFSSQVNKVYFFPSGINIAVICDDNTVQFLDIYSGKKIREVDFFSPVKNCVFSPDGRQIGISYYSDSPLKNSFQVLEIDSGRIQNFEGHLDTVWSISFSPDGKKIITGSADKTARIWDAETGRELRRLEGHSDVIHSVDITLDGRKVVTGSYDKTARIWDLESGNELRKLEGHLGPIFYAFFSSDGQSVVTAAGDNIARIWDTESGKERTRITGHSVPLELALFASDQRVVSLDSDFTLRIWNTDPHTEQREIKGHSDNVTSVAFSPDGKKIVTASHDKTARIWDTETGEELKRLEGHSASVLSVCFSPDGRQIATGSQDKTARIWDAEAGKELKQLQGHTGSILSIAFSPNGRKIVTASSDTTARIWDADSGRELRRLEEHIGRVFSISISPDSQFIVTGNEEIDYGIRIWLMETGEEIKKINTPIVLAVAFSKDGKQILSGANDSSIRVWNAKTGTETQTILGRSGAIISVIFSPDGKRIASTSDDKIARIWDATSGLELLQVSGLSERCKIAFSSDGQWIGIPCNDKTVRILDTSLEIRGYEEIKKILEEKYFSYSSPLRPIKK